MEKLTEYLECLTDFQRSSAENSETPNQCIPEKLNDYLRFVARRGMTCFPWELVKPLIIAKLENEMSKLLVEEDSTAEQASSFQRQRDHIMERVKTFDGIPFTIQRLCELLLNLKRHQNRWDKIMNSLEKIVTVVTCVDPFGMTIYKEDSSKRQSAEIGNGTENRNTSASSTDLQDKESPADTMDAENSLCPSRLSPLPPPPSSASNGDTKGGTVSLGKAGEIRPLVDYEVNSDDESEDTEIEPNGMTDFQVDSEQSIAEKDVHNNGLPNGSSSYTASAPPHNSSIVD